MAIPRGYAELNIPVPATAGTIGYLAYGALFRVAEKVTDIGSFLATVVDGHVALLSPPRTDSKKAA